jgi:6-pyruvoyltetrahydropterin/6-carboxytetrahydropterin synthase
MSTRLIRTVLFECLHRYEIPDWTLEKNRAEFGACFTPYGHGHSYKMEVWVEGEIQPETGMVINLKDLDGYLKAVVALVDKKHLNFEVPEFSNHVPTTENLAQFLFAKLELSLSASPARLIKVRLFENDHLWVDQSPDTLGAKEALKENGAHK